MHNYTDTTTTAVADADDHQRIMHTRTCAAAETKQNATDKIVIRITFVCTFSSWKSTTNRFRSFLSLRIATETIIVVSCASRHNRMTVSWSQVMIPHEGGSSLWKGVCSPFRLPSTGESILPFWWSSTYFEFVVISSVALNLFAST